MLFNNFKKSILLVEDEEMIRQLTKEVLQSRGYNILEAEDGEEAIEKLRKFKKEIDLVLLDVNLPRKNGIDVLREIRKDRRFKTLPVIIMTAYKDEEERAIETGASYFIPKPFSIGKMVALVESFIKMKEYYDQLENIEELLFFLAKIAEAKDGYTEAHIMRVKEFAKMIGKKMKLSERELWHLEKGAMLHDIGKIGIPDAVLFKKYEFTQRELEIMKKHTEIGYEICSSLDSLRDGAALVPYCHHERWDGKGYPRKLKGEEIPLIARIVSVCDAFDAMTTKRPYRPPLTYKEAIEELEKNAGGQFDPNVVKIFLSIKDKIIKKSQEIKKRYEDKEDSLIKLFTTIRRKIESERAKM